MCCTGEEAATMEKALGIPVVRHITKKPAGDALDLEKHFRSAAYLANIAHKKSGLAHQACNDSTANVL